MKKILILSSSPQRDKLIDLLLAEKLKAKGNEVYIRPIPVGAHKTILEIQPNVIVAPPIRQRFAWDLMDVAGKFGIGVVIRHIEPGCDEEDLKNMDEFWQKVLLLIRPDAVKLELFWSNTETNFIKEHGIKTPIAVVGAFVADIYKDKKLPRKIPAKAQLFAKHQLSPDKKLLLISSPWGLIDLAPDNSDKSNHLCQQDVQARDKWCEMVNQVYSHLKDKWNILATLHPSLDLQLYRQKVDVPIDTESTAAELLFHSDCLIHAGSTMAIEMHWLNKPAFQFGDVNSLDLPDGNWWQRRGCAISQVSPYYLDVNEMIVDIEKSKGNSNANPATIKALEEGRYGKMDGCATERAANLINQIDGEFKLYWPESSLNYDQLFLFKNPNRILVKVRCNICEKIFFAIDPKWLDEFNKTFKVNIKYPEDNACPHCAHNIAHITAFEQSIRKIAPPIK